MGVSRKVKEEMGICFWVERFVSLLLARGLKIIRRRYPTILVYHDVVANSDKMRIEHDSVLLEDFERQMKFLRENSFKPLPLQKAISLIESGEEIPEKSVIITFDDGYKSTSTVAAPILRKYEIPATVFVVTGFVGQEKGYPWLQPDGANSWLCRTVPANQEEIIRLHQEGFEIGAHTVNHRFLPLLTNQELEEEILGSRHTLQQILDRPPLSFALPFSFPMKHRKWPSFQRSLTSILIKGNFNSCCTMTRGHISANSNPLFLQRIAVGKFDDLQLFRAKLRGGYAWSRIPQNLFRVLFKKYYQPHSQVVNRREETYTGI